MTKVQFDAAYQAFCRRKPLRSFLIEFSSGAQLLIGHPEAVRFEDPLFMARCPDSSYVLFPPESVARLLDLPTS
jgi:hypothetical protein